MKHPRVLHAASLMRPSSGQLQQMNWEQQAALENDLPWTVKMFCPAGAAPDSEIILADSSLSTSPGRSVLARAMRWIKLRQNFYRWLSSTQSNYDVLILRYYVHDPFQYQFVANCDKPVVFYSHTLEVPELRMSSGVTGVARGFLESVGGRYTIGHANAILGVTGEVVEYQCNRAAKRPALTYVYPNGVMSDVAAVPRDDRSADVPELLFVANFLPWHGLAGLLQSMETSTEEFILHIVGDVPEPELIIAQRDGRVKIHGQQNSDEIDRIGRACWIGISSLELFRKGAKQAATLKAPQYLMMGLPVYGCGDVLPEGFPYYRAGDANIVEVLRYAREMREFSKNEIRERAWPFIDKRTLLMELYGKVGEWFPGSGTS